MIHTVMMLADRFESLLKYYDEKKIKVISREVDDSGWEYVKFEMTVSSPFDILEIFSAGVKYGIYMPPSMGLSK
jgi:hypothetical protein